MVDSVTVSMALYDALRKWDRNAICADINEAEMGWVTCPLCDIFLIKDCVGCPVSQATGQDACRGTTYKEAHTAWKAVKTGQAQLPAFHAPAKAYADFLLKIYRGLR